MQRKHMRYVNLEGYKPGPDSPKKPSDMNYPDFSDAVYPGAVTHPVTGAKVLGVVEQFLDRVITPQKAGLSNDEAIELLERLVPIPASRSFIIFTSGAKGTWCYGITGVPCAARPERSPGKPCDQPHHD